MNEEKRLKEEKKKEKKERKRKPIKRKAIQIKDITEELLAMLDGNNAIMRKEFEGSNDFVIELRDNTSLVIWFEGGLCGISQFYNKDIEKARKEIKGGE